jgi:hypothetical protein
MTPERALLARLVERLDKARKEGWYGATPDYADGRQDEAYEQHYWLTAELAKLEQEP